MLGPKILEEHNSKYSGTIRLMQAWGYKYVATGGLTQSGGLVHDVWKPILQKYAQNHKSWLILGLATGTIAEILSDKYSPSRLVGVEIDPIMLNLGRRHFGLDLIPGLEIINADARKYIARPNLYFDYILVDLYLGDQLPDFVYSPKFISRLKRLGQIVIINHLFYDVQKKIQAESLVQLLKQTFPHLTLHRVLTNLMFVCS